MLALRLAVDDLVEVDCRFAFYLTVAVWAAVHVVDARASRRLQQDCMNGRALNEKATGARPAT